MSQFNTEGLESDERCKKHVARAIANGFPFCKKDAAIKKKTE